MSRSGSPETAENNKYTGDRLAALLFFKVAREIQTVIYLLNWKDVCISYLLTTLVYPAPAAFSFAPTAEATDVS